MADLVALRVASGRMASLSLPQKLEEAGILPRSPQGARSCQRLAVGLRASGSERE